MRGRYAAWVGVLFAVSILSGCVSDEASGSVGSSAAPAPEATTTVDTGAIKGLVVSDEQVPIANAQVGLLETRAETRTDEAGAFTFNELAPGTATLVVQSLGFTEDAKKVTVLPGEVVEVKLVLKALEIPDESYFYTIPNKAFIKFGQWTVQYTQHILNDTNLNAALCDPCAFNLFVAPDTQGVLSEADWTPSVSAPVINHEIGMGVIKNYVQGQENSYMILTYLKPRGNYTWTETTVKSLKGDELVRLQVHGPGPGNPGIAFQQPVNMYTSFGVHGPLAEGFTALPPK